MGIPDDCREIIAEEAFRDMLTKELVSNYFVKLQGNDKIVVDAKFKKSLGILLKYLGK